MHESRQAMHIGKANIFSLISKDRLRTPLNREEDQVWLKKSLEGQMVKFDGEDATYAQRVKRCEERYLAQMKRKEGSNQTSTDVLSQYDELNISCSSNSSGSEASIVDETVNVEPKAKVRKLSGKDKLILEVSADELINVTAPIAERSNIGYRTQTLWLSSILKVGGVDINDLSISQTSVYRKRFQVIEDMSAQIREEESLRMAGLSLIVHFDTKKVDQIEDSLYLNRTVERLAVNVSSPDVEKLDVLLGILEIESSRGKDQANAIWEALCGWGIDEQVIGFCCDTTASNTGKYSGACANLSTSFASPQLYFMCRHHIYEVHISHILKPVFGETRGPCKTWYKNLHVIWPTIAEEVNSLENIVKFPWKSRFLIKGSLLHSLAVEAKEFFSTALIRDTFHRRDYTYLCQLVAFFLGAEVDFRFRQPGAFHEARFLADCNYILVLYMTQNYHQILDEENLMNIQVATIYIACFHAKMFIQSMIPSKAPTSDLLALKLSFDLIDNELPLIKDVARKLHDSVRRQSWYLAPPLVCLALADEDTSSSFKYDMLSKLLEYNVPSDEELRQAEPRLPQSFLLTSKTELIDFVDGQSYLLFKALKITKESLNGWKQWGKDTFEVGSQSPEAMEFRQFCEKVGNLQVVNDMSERHIRLVQDYIHRSRKEEHRQAIFKVVKDHRSKAPVHATKAILAKKD